MVLKGLIAQNTVHLPGSKSFAQVLDKVFARQQNDWHIFFLICFAGTSDLRIVSVHILSTRKKTLWVRVMG